MVYDDLIDILERSVERNGKDKPLTIGHLLNIVKLAQKKEQHYIREIYEDAPF